MSKSRIEAFSDGVIAILITITVLDLRPPKGTSLHDLSQVVPVGLTYVLSFAYLGIYWNNHHHMFQLVGRVNGRILWANLHLLFWLSLFPFATGWVGEHHFAAGPVTAYGVVLLLAGLAYYLLQSAIIADQGPGSPLAAAIGRDLKGKLSPVLYLVAVGTSFAERWAAFGLYAFVALMWLVPDPGWSPALSSRWHPPGTPAARSPGRGPAGERAAGEIERAAGAAGGRRRSGPAPSGLADRDVDAVEYVRERDPEQEARKAGLVVVTGRLVPDLVGNGIRPIGEAGRRTRRAASAARPASVKYGDSRQAATAKRRRACVLAELLHARPVHVDAEAAAVDLAHPQVDEARVSSRRLLPFSSRR